jgi:hypothetical protein
MPIMKAKKDQTIDMTEWGFIDWEDLVDTINTSITKILRRAFAEEPPEIYMSSYKNNNGRLTLQLPLGPTTDQPVYYDISLVTIIKDAMERNGDETEFVQAVAKMLKQCTKIVDQTLKNPPK